MPVYIYDTRLGYYQHTHEARTKIPDVESDNDV